jgi:hypothetical protein
MAVLDLRRTDLRTNIRENPYWISSAEIAPAADDADAILFVFPDVGGVYMVHDIIVEVAVLFAGGTMVMDLGIATIATVAITTGGAVGNQDLDEFMAAAEITLATAGFYPGGAIAVDAEGVITGTDWALGKAEGTIANLLITGVDADVPVVCATLTSDAVITAGSAYVHMLVSKLPVR